jgi:hypothetical protein
LPEPLPKTSGAETAVQGLPFMNEAVVSALEQRRYAPATLGGRAVDVRYTFKVRLEFPGSR